MAYPVKPKSFHLYPPIYDKKKLESSTNNFSSEILNNGGFFHSYKDVNRNSCCFKQQLYGVEKINQISNKIIINASETLPTFNQLIYPNNSEFRKGLETLPPLHEVPSLTENRSLKFGDVLVARIDQEIDTWKPVDAMLIEESPSYWIQHNTEWIRTSLYQQLQYSSNQRNNATADQQLRKRVRHFTIGTDCSHGKEKRLKTI